MYGYRNKGKARKLRLRRKRQPSRYIKRRTARGRTKIISTPRRGYLPAYAPDQQRVKLRYACEYELTGSATEVIYFGGNNLYDPEYATGGGQPHGFDQLATMYDRYKVHASSIRIRVIPNPAETADIGGSMLWASIHPSRGSVDATSTPSTIAGLPNAKTILTKSTHAGSPTTLTNFMRSNKIYGSKETLEAGSSSTSSSSVGQPWFWNVAFSRADKSVADLKAFVVVELTYYATFHQRKLLYDV